MSVLTPELTPDLGHRGDTLLRTHGGGVTDGRRWVSPLDPADHVALDRCVGPVLDVGCGPARHTLALAARGVPTLGVDITGPALDWARPRGALVLQRSVFDRLPGTGRWRTVLLLDGNIGIGGDPVALLRRAAELLATDGMVLAEFAAPGSGGDPTSARLEVEGAAGPWFSWAQVGRDRARSLAAAADLAVTDAWERDGRWFTALRRAKR